MQHRSPADSMLQVAGKTALSGSRLAQFVGMAMEPTTLWAEGERRLTLQEREGRFELSLHEHDRVIRLERCDSEHQAREKAHDWLIAMEVMRHQ